MLYRLPIFYQMRTQEEFALAYVPENESTNLINAEPVLAYATKAEAKSFGNTESVTS
jgi:hypothetical protein